MTQQILPHKSSNSATAVLATDELYVSFRKGSQRIDAVRGVSIEMRENEVLGVIGESGCGKSVLMYSLLGLLPRNAEIRSGSIHHIDTRNTTHRLTGKGGTKRMIALRGSEVSMVFQEPMSSLSPVHTIGDQIHEVLKLHTSLTKNEQTSRVKEVLSQVGFPAPARLQSMFPHQLSGGQRQRVMIAIAVACSPRLLIADEPTTALDVTIQAQILELLRRLQSETGMGLVLVSHNLGVVAELADRVAVMYMGRIIETGPVTEILEDPLHPYTRALVRCVPKLGNGRRQAIEGIPGQVPEPVNLPDACDFFERCPAAISGVCDRAYPRASEPTESRLVRCFLYDHKDGSDAR